MYATNAAGYSYPTEYIDVSGGGARRRKRKPPQRRPVRRRRTDALRKAVRDLIKHVKQPVARRRARAAPAQRAPAREAASAFSYLEPRSGTQRRKKILDRDVLGPNPPVEKIVVVDRDSVWKGAQTPRPDPAYFYPPPPWWGAPPRQAPAEIIQPIPPTPAARRQADEEPQVYYDAPGQPQERHPQERLVHRRPADGEGDQDQRVQRWSVDRVITFLERIPRRGRKLILTGLFGTAVGVVLDLLLGSPLNLTARLVRLIISLVPGGSLILNTLDGVGYLMGRFSDNPLQITYDAGFRHLANNVQQNLPQGTAEAIAQAAETQLGSGFMRQLGAALGYIVGTAPAAAPVAVPLALVRPFRP